MATPHSRAGWRATSLFVLLLALALSPLLAGCIKESSGEPHVGQINSAAEGRNTDRQNCDEIYGTAFRSNDERRWFEENCSRWPLVAVPQDEPRQQQASAPLPEGCAAQRGRPYESQEQRRWYLANCLGRDNQQQDQQQQPQEQQQQSSQPAQEADRQNCDEIRGTPYRSPTERTWFQSNCGAQVVTSGPDRTNCNEIRGTAYRSPTERAWFQANCGANAVTSGPDRTNCDEIRGNAYRSPNERAWFQANCGGQG
jgi:hypothetical protein